MHPAHHISSCRRRVGASLGLVLLAFALVGCASGDTKPRTNPSLLSGRRGGSIRRLAAAARVARRFADAYARSIYQRRPPRLPDATTALRRDLLAAASRVPPARRGRHPRALALTLRQRGAALVGVVEIGDGRSPPFSVGFLVRKRGSRWRVVTISPPG